MAIQFKSYCLRCLQYKIGSLSTFPFGARHSRYAQCMLWYLWLEQEVDL